MMMMMIKIKFYELNPQKNWKKKRKYNLDVKQKT